MWPSRATWRGDLVFLPTDDAQRGRLGVIEQQLNDRLWEIIRPCYDPGYDSNKWDAYLNRLFVCFVFERICAVFDSLSS